MVTGYLAPRVARRGLAANARAGLAVTAGRIGSVTRRDLTATRNSGYWLVVLSGFIEPALYLFSIGIGVGKLVGDFHLADGRVVGYAAFVAPAMLAASAMNGAMAEASFNFFARLKWARLYDAMVATPVRPFEIALGELAWAMLRGALYAAVFLGMMVSLDLTTVVRTVPALFGSLLVGLVFGTVGMAISTFLKTWQDFDYLNVFTFAMFLFSGTFVPADSYPAVLEVVVSLTPLYHGVELLRGFTLGLWGWGMLVHVAYLVALSVVGVWVASRRMTRLLCR